MALKQGTAAPTGITLTGVIIEKVDTTTKVVSIEKMDEDGLFGAGKHLRTEGEITITGTQLDDCALPAEGDGAGTAESPLITSVKVGDANEGASDFSISAKYWGAAPASADYGPDEEVPET